MLPNPLWLWMLPRDRNQPAPRARRRRPGRPSLVLEMLEVRLAPASVSWINPAGGDWDTASNWSTGNLPGAGADAVINLSGITITHNEAVADSVNSLASSAPISFSGGTLTLAAASTMSGALTLSGGTITGAGDLTVTGLLVWSGVPHGVCSVEQRGALP